MIAPSKGCSLQAHTCIVTPVTEIAFLKRYLEGLMPDFQDAITQFARGLPAQAVAMLASMIQQYSVSIQTSVLDELPDTVVFVLSGLITSYLLLRTNNVIALCQQGPGAVLGLHQVVNNERPGLKAISRETCVLGIIDGVQFRSFLQHWPAAYLTVNKILSLDLQNAYFQRTKTQNELIFSALPEGRA